MHLRTSLKAIAICFSRLRQKGLLTLYNEVRTLYDDAYAEASDVCEAPPSYSPPLVPLSEPKSSVSPDLSKPVNSPSPHRRKSLPDSFGIYRSRASSQVIYLGTRQKKRLHLVEEARRRTNIQIHADADILSPVVASTDDSKFPLVKITLSGARKPYDLHHTLRSTQNTGRHLQYFAGIFSVKLPPSAGDLIEQFEWKPQGCQWILLRMSTKELLAWTDFGGPGRKRSHVQFTHGCTFGEGFKWVAVVSMLYMLHHASLNEMTPGLLDAPPPQEETQFNEANLQHCGFANRKMSWETVRSSRISSESVRSGLCADTATTNTVHSRDPPRRRGSRSIRSMLTVDE